MFYRHLSFYRLTSPRGTLNKAATARAYRQIHSTSLFINGERRAAQDGKTFSVINPRTQEKVGVAAEASKADCLSAVDAAHAALPAWEQVAIGERSDLLRRAADVFTSPKYAEHIAQAVRDETDSSPLWAKSMCFKAANYLSAAAGMASEVRGSTYPSTAVPGALVLEQRRAMGVIYSVAPWNGPTALAIRGIAIPILCGNTVVLRASEYSPATQSIVIDALHEAGVPKGVVNFVTFGPKQAAALTADIIAHPAVRKITFTGSDVVGRSIAQEAAKWLKPCIMELGSKSPAVVLNDADVAHAARTIVFGALANSGQICMSTERVIVQRDIAPALLEAILELIGKLRAGDTHAGNAQIGALFSESAAEKVLSMIMDAENDGAKILHGDKTREGALIQPHVVTNIKPGMRLWDRESFGPVISIAEVNSVDEAVELANASDYSLAGALFTRDVNAALDVGGRIRAGVLNVNGPSFHPEPTNTEFGLTGASGYGRFSIEEFTDRRTVVIHPAKQDYPFFG